MINKITHRVSLFLTLVFVFLAGAYFLDESVSSAKVADSTVALPGDSLYQLPIKLKDQNGVDSDYSIYKGSPVIISLFYASCHYSCPVLLEVINKTLDSLSEVQKKKVKVLLVSFDPERDTPEALLKISKEHHLNLNQWKLAQASSDDVSELAAALNVKYRKLKDGEFNHTPFLGLLDEQGRLVVSSDNFAEGKSGIVSKIKELYP